MYFGLMRNTYRSDTYPIFVLSHRELLSIFSPDSWHKIVIMVPCGYEPRTGDDVFGRSRIRREDAIILPCIAPIIGNGDIGNGGS